MTLPQAKRLLVRQAGKVTQKSVALFLKHKINYRLARCIFLSAQDESALSTLQTYFVARILKGHTKDILFLNNSAFKENNPNAKSRSSALLCLESLAEKGIDGVLPGLQNGLNDSARAYFMKDGIAGYWVTNREVAEEGIRALAKKGNKKAKEILRKSEGFERWP